MSEIMSSVRETCILAKVSCTRLGLQRTDKAASAAANASHGAVDGAGKVVVSRLPGADDYHKRITKAQLDAAEALERLSMKWGEEKGWRLLPNRNFQKVIGEIQGARIEHDRLVAEMQSRAGEIAAAAMANKGSYDIDVPSAEEISNAYSMKVEFQPIPEATSFKGLPDSTLHKLTAALEHRVQASVDEAQVDVLRRCAEPIKHFIEAMEKYSEREAKKALGEEVGRHGTFRDSVVGNIKDIFERLGGFNVTGDPRIDELQNMMASLAEANPQDLRDMPIIRHEGVKRAQEIAQTLDSWLAPVTPQVTSEAAE